MIHSVICVDVETTGLNPSVDRIIEIGAILYSVKHATPIASFATLINGEGNAAEAINRIPGEALSNAPYAKHAWDRLGEMVDWAESNGPAAYMAHRASFDRGFLEVAAPALAARLPWICSKFDCVWPSSKRGASCVEMALGHGVPVVSAHRALTDCELIAKTMSAVAKTHDLASILAKALEPKVKVVSLAPYEERETVKANGFTWNKDRQEWWREMSIEDTAALPFQVEVRS